MTEQELITFDSWLGTPEGEEIMRRAIFAGHLTSCNCFKAEHNSHLQIIADLPSSQRPRGAAYWNNRRPRPFLPPDATFETHGHLLFKEEAK